MAEIEVKKLDQEELEKIGVFSWPIWSKEVSEFPWSYDSKESCYILKGKVTVTPSNGGKPASFEAGDFVVFPEGMECTWKIHEDVKKHYKFG